MADRSGIEWTEATWNPIRARNRVTGKVGWHCEHVSEACRNCYAERWNRPRGTGLAYKPGHRADVELFLDGGALLQPLRWRRGRTIFPCSMTDLFADFVPDAWLDVVFAVMALSPRHTFQVLTKRSDRMRAYLGAPRTVSAVYDLVCDLAVTVTPAAAVLVLPGMDEAAAPAGLPRVRLGRWPLPNVEVGVTAEDQPSADVRVTDLVQTPAALRWISAEPLLGRLDLTRISTMRFRGAEVLDGLTGELSGIFGDLCATRLRRVDRVVVGGESGPHARPMHPQWAREIRDACAAVGVDFFFKQWGEWAPYSVLPGGDLGREVRTGRVQVVHPSGRSSQELLQTFGTKQSEPGSRYMARVGKRAAGRTLDGVVHGTKPGAAA